ncbi:MAG: hypothetical protein Q9195_003649 [Heterodermia aff. obscurata]
MRLRITIILLAGCLIKPLEAADCNLSQQRQSDFPYGQQIASALTKQGALDNVCSDEFESQPNLIKIYNEGSVNYNITRKTTDEDPQDNNCQAGFQDIIDQCIVASSYWGGSYTFNDFTYAISNAVYPSNGLPSWDAASTSASSQFAGASTTRPLGTTSAAQRSISAGSSSTTGTPGSTTAAPGSTQTPSGFPTNSVSGVEAVTFFQIADESKFAPTTFSQYSDLTSSTTVTSTTTDSNGAPLLIPVVIGAGGIAWVIIGGIPPPGITPPGGIPGGGAGGDGNPSPTVTISNTGSASSTIQSSSSASSTTDGPSVTAIGDPEYGDIGNLQAAIIDPAGPVPDDGNSAVTTSLPITGTAPTTLSTSTTTQPALTTTMPTDTGSCEDDCTAIIPQLSIYGDMICSSDDLSKFVDHGTTTDADGEADWFRISSHANCYLVMAKSAAHRGFPDQYCFQKSAVIDFVNQNALGCNAGDPFLRKSGAQRPESQFTGSGEVCLANFKNYQSCGEVDL